MKVKTLVAMAALSLLIGVQSAEARGSRPGDGNPGSNSSRKLGTFVANCNTAGDAASASYQNVPNFGPSVQLQATQFGFASATVEGLDTSLVTMLGGIQFSVNGPVNNLTVYINFTTPAASSPTPFQFTVANGGIQKATAPNLYFIGTQNRNGTTQLPAGSKINRLDFQLQGTGGNQITDRISGVSFTGFGGVGYNLADPAAFCNTSM